MRRHRRSPEGIRHPRFTDESDYWEHQDEEKLKAYFARLDRLSNALADHLRNDVARSPEGGIDNLMDCFTRAAEMTHTTVEKYIAQMRDLRLEG